MIKAGNKELVRRKSLMETNPSSAAAGTAKKKAVASNPAATPAKSTRKDT